MPDQQDEPQPQPAHFFTPPAMGHATSQAGPDPHRAVEVVPTPHAEQNREAAHEHEARKKKLTPTHRKPKLPEVCPDCGYSPAKNAQYHELVDRYDELNDPAGQYGGQKFAPADRERYGVLGSEHLKWMTCGQLELHQQLDKKAAREEHDGEEATAVDDEDEGEDAGEGDGDAHAGRAERP